MGEHVAEGVVGRYAVWHAQESSGPFLLALVEHLHVDTGDGTANDDAACCALSGNSPNPAVIHCRRTPTLLHSRGTEEAGM